MGDGTLEDKLTDWLESSGRALELRTARVFRGRTRLKYVAQSMAYADPVSGQQREGDVVAAFRWVRDQVGVLVEAAIECKAGTSHPWVGFYDDRIFMPEDPWDWFLMSHGVWPAGEGGRLAQEWRAHEAFRTERVATHAVSALGNDSKNFVHDAARQVLSFARARGAMNYRFVDDSKGLTQLKAVAPIVVTNAPLFTCALTDAGEAVLERVDRFDLWLDLGKDHPRVRVYVRSEAALADTADALESIATRLGVEEGT